MLFNFWDSGDNCWIIDSLCHDDNFDAVYEWAKRYFTQQLGVGVPVKWLSLNGVCDTSVHTKYTKGEYRDAYNVQVSRSEGDAVGSLENVLGNSLEIDFEVLTKVNDLTCIGYFSDDINNNIYLFLTNYTDSTPSSLVYSTTGKNYIYSSG